MSTRTTFSSRILVAAVVVFSGCVAQADDHQLGNHPALKSRPHHQMMRGDMAAKLQKLHDRLKITADQEGDWKNWADSVTSSMEKHAADRPAPMDGANSALDAPDRLEQMAKFLGDEQSRVQQARQDLLPLYNKLSDGQKKTFNQSFTEWFAKRKQMMMHHGEHHRRSGNQDNMKQ